MLKIEKIARTIARKTLEKYNDIKRAKEEKITQKKEVKKTDEEKALHSQQLNQYKVSYSQKGEDLIIKHIFDGLGIVEPSYLDIGAHHPYHISNTALFYKNGSRGINIEPDPDLFVEINRVRKEDINLKFWYW